MKLLAGLVLGFLVSCCCGPARPSRQCLKSHLVARYVLMPQHIGKVTTMHIVPIWSSVCDEQESSEAFGVRLEAWRAQVARDCPEEKP